MDDKIYQKKVDCPLSDDDRLRLGELQSKSTIRIEQIEANLKDLKSELNQLVNARSQAAQIVRQKFETKTVNCRAEYHNPTHGMVSFFVVDDIPQLDITKPVVIEKMTQEQMEL